jgi:hypothetical protein
MDTDHWKRWLHDRLMTPVGNPGSLVLFGEPPERQDRMSSDQKGHFSYAKHLTNEVEVEEVLKGRGRVRRWKVKSDTQHWLDATYMAAVAGSMCGVSVIAGQAAAKRCEARVSYLTI